MTTTDARPRARAIHPAVLAQRVDQRLRRLDLAGRAVLLVQAEPSWPHATTITTPEGRTLTVVACPSPLAIWDQLAREPDHTLILLTDLSERELGSGILSRAHRQQIVTVEPWDLVMESFGASGVDLALQGESWAGEALLEAVPPEGWGKVAGAVLSRDVALRQLAAARLGLSPADLDAQALLRWSASAEAVEAFAGLREVERAGLTGWLAAEGGRPAKALFQLLGAGHGTDALPLGLVCQAVWSAEGPDALRAQGRIEQYFGDVGALGSETIERFGQTAVAVVEALLRAAEDTSERDSGARLLDRAETLLTGFGAAAIARHSTILRTGFDHRLDAVAAALSAGLAQPAPRTLAAADAAVAELSGHRLAGEQPHRVERAEMALRLLRWLATEPRTPQTVADGITGQLDEWGWVDLAMAHVWSGEEVRAPLKQAFGTIYGAAGERRRAVDAANAGRLAAWSAAGTPAESLLPVEEVLARVVAPVVRQGERPVLLVVLDGMSAAVAADLAADLTQQHWVEHDPLAGAAGDGPRRRGALAAVPSVTETSRTSLLSGALRRGDAAQERAAFAAHRLWRRRPARLFHKGLISGGAGESLDAELVAALEDPTLVVGVVINTVDEALYYGRESADPGWRVAQLGPLRALLDHARYHGRAVIITSDHGHVLDRGTQLRQVPEPPSARHRTDPAPPADGEVELVGPRVLADGQRVVALWDPTLRYLPRRAGYHGGAALAEMTIPVLAFLHLGAAAPRGWAPLPEPQPAWWSPTKEPAPAAPAPRTPPTPSRQPTPAGEPLFTLAAPPSLVEALLGSEMFAAQHALAPRRVPESQIRTALAALIEANGVLPTVVVAQRAEVAAPRARGFITTLQHIFNVDHYPVLSLIDDGRTVRLDLSLLRAQFRVGGEGTR